MGGWLVLIILFFTCIFTRGFTRFLPAVTNKIRVNIPAGKKNDSLCIVVFLWGGMNSWFLYEFTVLSMGSILANIADNLLKVIMPY